MIDKVEEDRGVVSVSSSHGAMSVYSRISDPVAAAKELGAFYHQSGMLGVKTPAAGAVLALHCMCEGITPFQFDRTYHIMFDNTLSMKYDAMLSGFLALGGKYKIVSRTPERAEIFLSLDGREGTFAMTLEEAQGEAYYYQKDKKTPKDNWSTPRRRMQMLWARVVSDSVNTICPQVSAGVSTPEEVMDFSENTDAVDVEYTSKPQSEPVTDDTNRSDNSDDSSPASGEAKEAEEVPFEASQPEPCTTEQLIEIVRCGARLGQGKEVVAASLVNAYEVSRPQELTFEQARDAIEKMRTLYDQKKSTSSQAV